MIWDACEGTQHIQPIQGTLYRLVESQEQIATQSLVDTLDEQAVLEQLLEATKPAYPHTNHELHYLLKTPFRYPPLQWGSRFGRVYEPSLFYGGCSITSTLSESAYYRFVFIHTIQGKPPESPLRTSHTLFSVKYSTVHAVKLHQDPFDQHSSLLTHPSDYRATQQLGSDMREARVKAFEYLSARSSDAAHCVALYDPSPFVSNQPDMQESWLCETRPDYVLLKAVGTIPLRFSFNDFAINGQLPLPA